MPSPEPRIFSSTSDVTRLGLVCKNIIIDFPISIGVAWAIAQRNFKTKYRTSKLGYLWAVLSPTMYAVIFVVVREGMKSRGLSIDTQGVPPGLFAFVGIALFQVWMDGLLGQVDVIRANRGIASNVDIPSEAFFMATLIGTMIDTGIRIIMVLIALLLFGISPGPFVWLFPFVAVALVFTGNAIGYLLAPISNIYRDIRNTIQSITLGILLISPIFYPATQDESSWLYVVNLANPLAVMVTTARETLIGTEFMLAGPAIIWMISLMLLTLVMIIVMRIIHLILVERLG